MNKQQKNILIGICIAFAICAIVNLAGFGSSIFADKLGLFLGRLAITVFEWAAMVVVYVILWFRFKD